MSATGDSKTISFRRLSEIVAVAFVAAMVVFAATPAATAHRSSGWVPIGQNKIYNWDYTSQNTSYSKADWPVNIIFWNNSSPQKVKDNRQDIFGYNCNVLNLCNQYHRSFQANPDNGNGWDWDYDGGRKEFACWPTSGANAWSLHYRVYENESNYTAAAEDDTMPLWDPGWGYFTPMTSHYDIDDPQWPGTACDRKAHGYDETAEGWIVSYYNALSGWQGVNDWTVHFHNNPPSLRVIGGIDHWGNGNAKTSIVYVP